MLYVRPALLGFFLLSAGAAHAQAVSATSVTLATAPSNATLIVRDQSWRCAGTTCTTGPIASRPLIACMALARKAGRVERFQSGNAMLDTAALARCNAVAQTVAAAPQ